MKEHNGVVQNLFWKFAERIAAQSVTLIVSIIIARLLSPSDYGIVSIVTIFITLANVFVSDGFGSALIQKKNADGVDFSTVLYFNLAFSTLLYVILYVSAPYITLFFGAGYEILTPVLRVLGLRIIISGANSVQQAYVSKKMIFRKFFLSTFCATVISAIIGVVLAYKGFGVWALVAQYLSNAIVSTLILCITLRKLPLLKFSISRLKTLFSFGSKILGTSLLITGFVELRALIIGKVYTSADLAYYDKGKHFPDLVVTNINYSISAVLFPKMANDQDDNFKIKTTMRNSIRFGAYVMSPMILGLAAVAEPFIRLVLTEKWLPCVSMLRLFCIIYLFQPVHTANLQAIKAIGRSDVFFKLEILKKAIETIALLLTVWISVDAIVVSMAITTTFFTAVNAYPNQKLFGYSIKEQLIDIFPALFISTLMSVSVYMLSFLPINDMLLLLLQVVCGIIIYLLLSVITKNREFAYIIKIAKSIFCK